MLENLTRQAQEAEGAQVGLILIINIRIEGWFVQANTIIRSEEIIPEQRKGIVTDPVCDVGH